MACWRSASHLQVITAVQCLECSSIRKMGKGKCVCKVKEVAAEEYFNWSGMPSTLLEQLCSPWDRYNVY